MARGPCFEVASITRTPVTLAIIPRPPDPSTNITPGDLGATRPPAPSGTLVAGPFGRTISPGAYRGPRRVPRGALSKRPHADERTTRRRGDARPHRGVTRRP